MGVKFTNNAATTLAAGINNSVTSITVASSSTFPSISGSNYFYATFDDLTNNEVVKVTAVSGTTWTVVRAQDDTSARAFSSGDTVELRLNVALLEDALGDAATFARDAFTGDGSDTTFTLSQTAASENNLIVFIEGIFQTQSTYSLSGTTLTFSTAPANSREIIVYSTQALSAGTVTTASIIDANITTAKLADDAVTVAKMAVNSIDSDQYVDGSIDTAHIAADAVTAAKLADNAVVTANIADDNVTTAKIADDQITLAKMAGLVRGKIIYGDSSGNPAALTVGSNGQVLKSDGTDISWGTDATVAALTSEEVQDIAGAMFTSNTETGITATYQDADGTIDLVVGTLNQDTTGSAATLTTARTIAMTGDVVWSSGSFDGSGNVTAASTIQTDAVDIAMLSATGTASSSTFLRGDNSWTAVSTPITALNNATANELVTVGSTTTELDAESNLTFDGSTLAVTGALTVDDMTLNGSTISDAGAFIIDVGGRITLDNGDGYVQLSQNGTAYGFFDKSGGALSIQSVIDDGDIVLRGKDGGVVTTFLTLDASEAGAATFNGVVTIPNTSAANVNNESHILVRNLANGNIVTDQLTYNCAEDKLGVGTNMFVSGGYIRSGNADLGFGTAAQGQLLTLSNSTGVVSGDLNDTSDVALKENITDITGGLSIIKQLQPRNFDWKQSGKVTGAAGFIAQEVATILPKEVQGEDYSAGTIDEDGVKTGNTSGKGINVTGIVAHLTKAVQELEARIATLEG
tara:strand:- start:635 stop:2884 length:2250 start_codon:yes stop_codon:yes gene_type:complete